MVELRDNVKLLIKYFMRFCLKVYWIFPIKENTIFFMANMGKGYLCNPKYIYESLIKDPYFKNVQFIWCFKRPEIVDENLFSDTTIIVKKKNYIKYFYYLLTSKIVVYNCGGFSYAPIRKKQYLIETAHGGGLQKCNGFLIKNKSKASNKGIEIASKDIKLWISPSKLWTKLYARQAMHYYGEMLNAGFPRNDILFHCTNDKIKNIKGRLNLSENKKVVLYAPTFKGNENHAVCLSDGYEKIDVKTVKRKLAWRFGGDWIFAKRGHQYALKVDIEDADVDWTFYPDMQELLLITDVLITDYSSSIWDFSLMKKPCFLFTPDLKAYRDNERGFYIDIMKWPGVLAETNAQLSEAILKFDYEKYEEKIEDYLLMMGSYENGTAREIVKNKLKQYIRREANG